MKVRLSPTPTKGQLPLQDEPVMSQPLAPERPSYAKLTQLNSVPLSVINSLGGLQDTVSPMIESLKRTELRMYEEAPDYPRQIQMMRSGQIA